MTLSNTVANVAPDIKTAEAIPKSDERQKGTALQILHPWNGLPTREGKADTSNINCTSRFSVIALIHEQWPRLFRFSASR